MGSTVHTIYRARTNPGTRRRRNDDPPGAPEVSVNGVVIDEAAIAHEMQNHPAARPEEAWNAAVRALIVRELLLQRAAALDIKAEPSTDAAGRRETEQEALIRALLERELKTPEPDDETCRRYYRQNLARFRSPSVYEVSHILFAAPRDEPAAFERARAEAAAVLNELKAHPARFTELALVHSDCPSVAQGGNLGQIAPGQVTPEFEKALGELAPGEITPSPVETRYGLHIIRLDRRMPERELPYELVAGRVAEYLRDSVTHRATAQYVARLVSAAEITGWSPNGA